MNLETKRLYLRPLKYEDANGNYPNWLNDKTVCRYNSHGDTLYTKEMALKYIDMVNNSPKYRVFAIMDKKEDGHIGNISLQQIDQTNKKAEFAILIGERNFWGKGYAKEAGKLLIDYGFSKLNLREIYCGTSEENLPMQRLAISLNMKLKNISRKDFKKDGCYFDTYHYSLLSDSI